MAKCPRLEEEPSNPNLIAEKILGRLKYSSMENSLRVEELPRNPNLIVDPWTALWEAHFRSCVLEAIAELILRN